MNRTSRAGAAITAGRLMAIGLAGCLCAQQPPPLRVEVSILQVDAVVTGPDGRPVTDLRQEEFEVLVDGQPRPVKYLSYVQMGAVASVVPGSAPGKSPAAAALSPSTVRRTVALVVDDLRMSMESLHFTREALKKFIDEQMAPGDLVAIVSTSGRVGPLQQFTTDKAMLRSAVGRLWFLLNGGGQGGTVKPLGSDVEDPNGSLAYLRQRRFNVGTMGAVRQVIAGMRTLPGRKSVVLFADGVAISRHQLNDPSLTAGELNQVAQGANQAAVVIYTIDPRGITFPGIQAQDDLQGMEEEQVRVALEGRRDRTRQSAEGLRLLAAETGGLPYLNTNDIAGSLGRVMQDQSGYYLLGLAATELDVSQPKQSAPTRRITIRVRRPGLRVRYRRSYVGGLEGTARAAGTPGQQLAAAIASPFAVNELRLRLTPIFTVGPNGKSLVRALLHVDGRELEFGAPDSTGQRLAQIRILALLESDDPKAQAAEEKTYGIRVQPEALARIQHDGLVYSLPQEVSKPGPYQLRVAVRDQVSGRIGSAARFIEVPDLSRGALAVSGITMVNGDWRASGEEAAATPGATDISPAARVFERNQTFSYGVMVYNARPDSKSGKTDWELQPRLIRGEAVVWEGQRIPVVAPPGADARRLPAGGVLRLGARSLPGEYLLEVQVIDRTGKHAPISQWMDFDLQ